ncbi:MAG TPA: alpha/beta hydrolase [Thiobacillaceae bacterium]|nr:alpha/beta hydrolase [Thiobacillaceae bacterium]HNU65362.1 alpha/beta hydrolase [Thiobacillaceae bacterium]
MPPRIRVVKRYNLRIKGPVGDIETLIEDPGPQRRGLALIAHPHPLHGGSLDNKVTWTLARAALRRGLVAVRSNFRGVGRSAGAFDQGLGETEDLLRVAAVLGAQYPGLFWSLLGFSFGAYVQNRVAARMAAERLILVGPAMRLYAFDAPDLPTHIIHGSADELIPVAVVRAYAQDHGIPLHEVEGADHFFHGKLKPLRALAEDLCP